MSTTTKPYRGLPMEGPIAKWYAKNRRPDAEFADLVNRICELLPEGSRILEVAPGPGTLAIELARRGFQTGGVDISRSFVAMARSAAGAAGVQVDFRHGNAADLPFDAGSFDLVVCRAAFKNFSDPVGALREMSRIVRQGGQALINDLRRDASAEEIATEVATMGLSPLNAWLTRNIFRFSLLKRAYTGREMEFFIEQTDFTGYEIKTARIGMDVWLRKG